MRMRKSYRLSVFAIESITSRFRKCYACIRRHFQSEVPFDRRHTHPELNYNQEKLGHCRFSCEREKTFEGINGVVSQSLTLMQYQLFAPISKAYRCFFVNFRSVCHLSVKSEPELVLIRTPSIDRNLYLEREGLNFKQSYASLRKRLSYTSQVRLTPGILEYNRICLMSGHTWNITERGG